MTELGLREPLLRAGFGVYNGEFASGAQANNKLQLGYDDLQAQLALRCRVTQALIELLRQQDYGPDLVIPVPTGANGYGKEIADALGIACIILGKDAQARQPYFRAQTQAAVQTSERIVIVEDVPNALSSVHKVLELPGIGERAVGVIGIWDRGDPSSRAPLPVTLHTLITEPIPASLPPDSEYWQYAA